jgi:hypothetical protein
VGSWKGPFVLAGRDVGLAGYVARRVPVEWCSGACTSRMRRLPGVAWPQCGSWLAAWSSSPDIGEAACNRGASYPVSRVWPPASRGGQLPGEMGMTIGGPRQPSLAQCSADDSEDRSLWTRWVHWRSACWLKITYWWLMIAGWELRLLYKSRWGGA